MNIKEQIEKALKNKGVILSYTFFPRINFKGLKILSCTKHNISCIVQTGICHEQITLDYDVLSDEVLEIVKDGLIKGD